MLWCLVVVAGCGVDLLVCLLFVGFSGVLLGVLLCLFFIVVLCVGL